MADHYRAPVTSAHWASGYSDQNTALLSTPIRISCNPSHGIPMCFG